MIPTFRNLDYAARAARSALEATPNSLVIVVDDGSPDWSPKWFKDLPPKQLVVHRFPKNDRNLTRSWNWGLLKASERGAAYAVATNSDTYFPPGWFAPIRAALDAGALDLAAPVTNAPGHRPRQRVNDWLPGYVPSEDPGRVRGVQEALAGRHGGLVVPGPVNGFCMAARTATWWRGAYSGAAVFHPKYKMTRNEDELMGRWKRLGLRTGFVPASFVLHFRGVSRKGATSGREGRGWLRAKDLS